ncbi:hypothetical protein BpHYR1_017299 [Brachionus plicatilis]|uniref:Uncharacterized protein n=1 Tax=Brachionus plicatilis TaxID=10195 RepID=A0A3M7R555_BRAPC|nr:hypothetical protein BpHYR1_017299 [Brachionus plicatilis]
MNREVLRNLVLRNKKRAKKYAALFFALYKSHKSQVKCNQDFDLKKYNYLFEFLFQCIKNLCLSKSRLSKSYFDLFLTFNNNYCLN